MGKKYPHRGISTIYKDNFSAHPYKARQGVFGDLQN
jgi:hypothetical protein